MEWILAVIMMGFIIYYMDKRKEKNKENSEEE